MEFKDYYKILGVKPDADSKDIKAAYRKLARRYHPDVSDHHQAEEKFKEVTEAYEALSDTQRRAQYDELRQYGRHGQSFEPPPQWQSAHSFDQGAGSAHHRGFSDFFSSIFGGFDEGFGQPFHSDSAFQQQRGKDIETDFPVFLEDTLSDKAKTISYEMPHYDDRGQVNTVKKTLNVKIPAGVTDGERIRLRGQGGQGMGNAPAGDLYLRIRLVPHPLFDVEGHNLILTLPIAPWEAALGTKVTIPTLTGKIQLHIPENSQTGQRLRIKGKGLIGKVTNGDLYAVLKVVMPNTLNEDIKQQWQQLASKANFDARAEWSEH